MPRLFKACQTSLINWKTKRSVNKKSRWWAIRMSHTDANSTRNKAWTRSVKSPKRAGKVASPAPRSIEATSTLKKEGSICSVMVLSPSHRTAKFHTACERTMRIEKKLRIWTKRYRWKVSQSLSSRDRNLKSNLSLIIRAKFVGPSRHSFFLSVMSSQLLTSLPLWNLRQKTSAAIRSKNQRRLLAETSNQKSKKYKSRRRT